MGERLNLLVIGDSIEDRFPIFSSLLAQGDDRERAARRPGGALFTKKAISEGLESHGRGLDAQVDVHGYANEKAIVASPPAYTEWELLPFGPEKIIRCQPTPRSKQEIPFNRTFAGYELPAALVQDCDLCVIQDLAIDQLIAAEPVKRDASYSYMFARDPAAGQSAMLQLHALLHAMQKKAAAARSRNDFAPTLFLLMNRTLPRLDNPLWSVLLSDGFEDLRERTVVFSYADTLRWHGLHISKQISWERSAQDFLSQWYTHPTLKRYHKLGGFILRFGITGAIYSYKLGMRRVHRLFFDPCADEVGIYRDVSRDGDIVGHQTALLCNVVTRLLELRIGDWEGVRAIGEAAVPDEVALGIRRGIKHCQALFDVGFGRPEGDNWLKIDESLFAKGKFPQFAEKSSPIGDERIPVGCASWNILTQAAEYSLQRYAADIVKFGVTKVFNLQETLDHSERTPDTPPRVPVLTFGPRKRNKNDNPQVLYVVDRREIESYRVVRNMMCKSIASATRPLSIAIFGPPGAGKSFVARKIVQSAFAVTENEFKEHCHFDELNLAQLTSWAELDKRIQEGLHARQASNGKKVPVFFFDEFDCVFEGRDLGWLKYFLRHMETDARAIFIFAGGISRNYLEFTRERALPGTQDVEEFKRRDERHKRRSHNIS